MDGAGTASPNYYFVWEDADARVEYEHGWSLSDIFAPNGDLAPGIVTTHDQFATSWTREEVIEKVERLLATQTEEEARQFWRLCSQNQWNYGRAKRELADGRWRQHVVPILYRPFDVRWTVYDHNVAVHRRERVSGQMLHGSNLSLLTNRQVNGEFRHVLCATTIVNDCTLSTATKERTYQLPLWFSSQASDDLLDNASSERRPNVAPEFVDALTAGLGKIPTPEDTLAYVYAVLHAPSYRARYADFLKRDFPRVPLTTDLRLFDTLVAIGRELIGLHTMDAALERITGYPVAGSNEVLKVRWAENRKGDTGRVYINAEQYFEDVPQTVWEMFIGGYRVAEKWLKDRKCRELSYDEITHYQAVIAALARTLGLQADLDVAVESAGGWPLY